MPRSTRTSLTIVTVVRNDTDGLASTAASLGSAVSVLASEQRSQLEWVIVDGSDKPVTAPQLAGISVQTLRQEPVGIFEAMNAGLDQASGHWIYFLNAGDTLASPDALERLLEALQSTAAPWGFAGVEFQDATGRRLHEPEWDYARERSRVFAAGRFPPHQGTLVATKELRDMGGFDTRYRVSADYHAALKLALQSDPEVWPWVLAVFRQGGASSSNWRQAHREMHRARLEVFAPTAGNRVREAWFTWLAYGREWLGRALASIQR